MHGQLHHLGITHNLAEFIVRNVRCVYSVNFQNNVIRAYPVGRAVGGVIADHKCAILRSSSSRKTKFAIYRTLLQFHFGFVFNDVRIAFYVLQILL